VPAATSIGDRSTSSACKPRIPTTSAAIVERALARQRAEKANGKRTTASSGSCCGSKHANADSGTSGGSSPSSDCGQAQLQLSPNANPSCYSGLCAPSSSEASPSSVGTTAPSPVATRACTSDSSDRDSRELCKAVCQVSTFLSSLMGQLKQLQVNKRALQIFRVIILSFYFFAFLFFS
jgi:hypothetical protein